MEENSDVLTGLEEALQGKPNHLVQLARTALGLPVVSPRSTAGLEEGVVVNRLMTVDEILALVRENAPRYKKLLIHLSDRDAKYFVTGSPSDADEVNESGLRLLIEQSLKRFSTSPRIPISLVEDKALGVARILIGPQRRAASGFADAIRNKGDLGQVLFEDPREAAGFLKARAEIGRISKVHTHEGTLSWVEVRSEDQEQTLLQLAKQTTSPQDQNQVLVSIRGDQVWIGTFTSPAAGLEEWSGPWLSDLYLQPEPGQFNGVVIKEGTDPTTQDTVRVTLEKIKRFSPRINFHVSDAAGKWVPEDVVVLSTPILMQLLTDKKIVSQDALSRIWMPRWAGFDLRNPEAVEVLNSSRFKEEVLLESKTTILEGKSNRAGKLPLFLDLRQPRSVDGKGWEGGKGAVLFNTRGNTVENWHPIAQITISKVRDDHTRVAIYAPPNVHILKENKQNALLDRPTSAGLEEASLSRGKALADRLTFLRGVVVWDGLVRADNPNIVAEGLSRERVLTNRPDGMNLTLEIPTAAFSPAKLPAGLTLWVQSSLKGAIPAAAWGVKVETLPEDLAEARTVLREKVQAGDLVLLDEKNYTPSLHRSWKAILAEEGRQGLWITAEELSAMKQDEFAMTLQLLRNAGEVLPAQGPQEEMGGTQYRFIFA